MNLERDILHAAWKAVHHEIDREILETVLFDGMNGVDQLGYLATHDSAPPCSKLALEKGGEP